MTSVKEAWGMQCPQCADDESIHIFADVEVALYDDGTEEQGGHEWTSKSHCHCTNCGFFSTVGDFEVNDDNAEVC